MCDKWILLGFRRNPLQQLRSWLTSQEVSAIMLVLHQMPAREKVPISLGFNIFNFLAIFRTNYA